MKAIAALLLLALGIASNPLPATHLSAAERPGAVLEWEYRVLTKGRLLELGKRDLTAALEQLGKEGWELAAIDSAYIFKRPKPRLKDEAKRGREDLQRRLDNSSSKKVALEQQLDSLQRELTKLREGRGGLSPEGLRRSNLLPVLILRLQTQVLGLTYEIEDAKNELRRPAR